MDALHLVEHVSIQVFINFAVSVAAHCDIIVYRRRDDLATVDVERRWLLS